MLSVRTMIECLVFFQEDGVEVFFNTYAYCIVYDNK